MKKDNEPYDIKLNQNTLLCGFIGFIVYYIAFQAFYNDISEGTCYPYTDIHDALLNVSLNFTPIFIIFVTDVSIIFKLDRLRNIRWKLVIDFLLTNGAVTLVNFAFLAIMSGSQYCHINWAGTLFNNLILFFAIETVYYVIHFQNKTIEVEKQKQTVLRYQYNALKAQISPHFLFNSLSILSALVSRDIEKAREFIKWLSEVYRYIMAKQDMELVTLDEELSFMSSYVKILTLRYDDKFSVTVEGEENISHQHVPPYSLQLLIENITKHNTISSRLPMEVHIAIACDGIRISNPIHYRYSESPAHLGLHYLASIYKSYGIDFHTENNGKTFTVFMPYIP